MKRSEAIRTIAQEAGDALIVCNLGYPSRELYAAMDRKANFYMLGSMGLASSIGLGLALSRPDRKVIALDGDGSVMMNLGTLSTIASYEPKRYLLVILDNGVYGSTGCQVTPICRRSSLKQLAIAAGVENVNEVSSSEDLKRSIEEMENGVLVVKVEPGNDDAPLIDLTPQQILERFRAEAAR